MGEKKEKKKEPKILMRFYTLTDPLIRKLPGRTSDEKRVVFTTLIVGLILVIYITSLATTLLTYGAPGYVLYVILYLIGPILVALLALDIIYFYGRRYKEARKVYNYAQTKEDMGEKDGDGEHNDKQP